MTSLRQKLIEYIRIHGQVHFRDIEKYAEENGYKAYTAVRRLQEVRDASEGNSNYDPEIGTIEENGTIKFYVYKPSVKPSETQNLPRGEEKPPQPHSDYVPPIYEPKQKPQPYVYTPPENCCDVAIYCQTKRLPVSHKAGCETQKQVHS